MRAANILHLGIKELRGLARDPILLVLIIYSFTLSVYSQATVTPDTLHNAAIAIVDEDNSALSAQLISDFYPPYFQQPVLISLADMDKRLDAGMDTFTLVIPPEFQHDLLAGRNPEIQLNVDATRMTEAFSGAGYIQNIAGTEIGNFLQRSQTVTTPPADLSLRIRFNPNLTQSWLGSVMSVIDSITMLSVVLTGAALIREREHGTVEHLLVMPVTPVEIMLSKIWSMGLVVLLAAWLALVFVVQGVLAVPIHGSVALFMAGAFLDLFATTAMGIALATVADTMPQFGLLLMLVILPLQVLSGSLTPRESMPVLVQDIMQAAPNTHFVQLAQAILFRGAGLDAVWPQFLALLGIGAVLFMFSAWRFRRALK